MDSMQRPQDFYQRIRKRIHSWANTKQGKQFQWIEIILIAPDLFYLIIRLAADPEVPVSVKSKLTIATLYIMHPVDLIPELIIGYAGFLDDVVLSAYVLYGIFHDIPSSVIEKYWSGQSEVLIVIKRITLQADELIGSKIFRKLRMMFH
ncbi:YkvA family protein [bacterium]